MGSSTVEKGAVFDLFAYCVGPDLRKIAGRSGFGQPLA